MFKGKINKLREICQNTDRGRKTYAVLFARRFSIYITNILIKFNISPNIITLLSVVLVFIIAFLFLSRQKTLLLVNIFLFQFWYILDHVDGEVARYKNKRSLTGKYLDMISHFITSCAVFLAIGYGGYIYWGNYWIFILASIGAISVIIFDIVHWYGPLLSLYSNLIDYLKDFKQAVKANSDYCDTNKIGYLENKVGGIKNTWVRNWKTFNRILFLWHYPSIMNVLCIASFLDILFVNALKEKCLFGFLEGVILFYSLTFPILTILFIIKQAVSLEADRSAQKYIEMIG